MRRWSDDGIDRHGARWIDVAEPLSASQVNKRLRALENLYTRARRPPRADNPVREVAEPDEPEAAARGLPYDVVEAILAQLPDRGRPTGAGKGTRPKVSLTKLRLTVIPYAGLSHGEIAGLEPPDLVHLDDASPSVWVKGRRKGRKTTGVEQPLTERRRRGHPRARIAAAGGLGTFSASAMWKTFQRACRKLGLTGIRPYNLRHSFASEVFEKTGNLSATQLLMRHRDQRTTLRYGQRALSPVQLAAIAAVSAAAVSLRQLLSARPQPTRNTRQSRRTPASGAEGRRFESCRARHHTGPYFVDSR